MPTPLPYEELQRRGYSDEEIVAVLASRSKNKDAFSKYSTDQILSLAQERGIIEGYAPKAEQPTDDVEDTSAPAVMKPAMWLEEGKANTARGLARSAQAAPRTLMERFTKPVTAGNYGEAVTDPTRAAAIPRDLALRAMGQDPEKFAEAQNKNELINSVLTAYENAVEKYAVKPLESYSKAVEKAGGERKNWSGEKGDSAAERLGDFAQWTTRGVLENAPQLGVSIVAGMITKNPAAAMGLMGMMEHGGALEDTDQLVKDGIMTPEQQREYAATVGILNSYLERYGATQLADALIKPAAKKGLKQFAIGVLKNMAAEGGTEASQDFAPAVLRLIEGYRDKNQSVFDYLKEQAGKALQSGYFGAIMGGGVTALSGTNADIPENADQTVAPPGKVEPLPPSEQGLSEGVAAATQSLSPKPQPEGGIPLDDPQQRLVGDQPLDKKQAKQAVEDEAAAVAEDPEASDAEKSAAQALLDRHAMTKFENIDPHWYQEKMVQLRAIQKSQRGEDLTVEEQAAIERTDNGKGGDLSEYVTEGYESMLRFSPFLAVRKEMKSKKVASGQNFDDVLSTLTADKLIHYMGADPITGMAGGGPVGKSIMYSTLRHWSQMKEIKNGTVEVHAVAMDLSGVHAGNAAVGHAAMDVHIRKAARYYYNRLVQVLGAKRAYAVNPKIGGDELYSLTASPAGELTAAELKRAVKLAKNDIRAYATQNNLRWKNDRTGKMVTFGLYGVVKRIKKSHLDPRIVLSDDGKNSLLDMLDSAVEIEKRRIKKADEGEAAATPPKQEKETKATKAVQNAKKKLAAKKEGKNEPGQTQEAGSGPPPGGRTGEGAEEAADRQAPPGEAGGGVGRRGRKRTAKAAPGGKGEPGAVATKAELQKAHGVTKEDVLEAKKSLDSKIAEWKSKQSEKPQFDKKPKAAEETKTQWNTPGTFANLIWDEVKKYTGNALTDFPGDVDGAKQVAIQKLSMHEGLIDILGDGNQQAGVERLTRGVERAISHFYSTGLVKAKKLAKVTKKEPAHTIKADEDAGKKPPKAELPKIRVEIPDAMRITRNEMRALVLNARLPFNQESLKELAGITPDEFYAIERGHDESNDKSGKFRFTEAEKEKIQKDYESARRKIKDIRAEQMGFEKDQLSDRGIQTIESHLKAYSDKFKDAAGAISFIKGKFIERAIMLGDKAYREGVIEELTPEVVKKEMLDLVDVEKVKGQWKITAVPGFSVRELERKLNSDKDDGSTKKYRLDQAKILFEIASKMPDKKAAESMERAAKSLKESSEESIRDVIGALHGFMGRGRKDGFEIWVPDGAMRHIMKNAGMAEDIFRQISARGYEDNRGWAKDMAKTNTGLSTMVSRLLEETKIKRDAEGNLIKSPKEEWGTYVFQAMRAMDEIITAMDAKKNNIADMWQIISGKQGVVASLDLGDDVEAAFQMLAILKYAGTSKSVDAFEKAVEAVLYDIQGNKIKTWRAWEIVKEMSSAGDKKYGNLVLALPGSRGRWSMVRKNLYYAFVGDQAKAEEARRLHPKLDKEYTKLEGELVPKLKLMGTKQEPGPVLAEYINALEAHRTFMTTGQKGTPQELAALEVLKEKREIQRKLEGEISELTERRGEMRKLLAEYVNAMTPGRFKYETGMRMKPAERKDGSIIYQKDEKGQYKLDENGNKLPVFSPLNIVLVPNTSMKSRKAEGKNTYEPYSRENYGTKHVWNSPMNIPEPMIISDDEFRTMSEEQFKRRVELYYDKVNLAIERDKAGKIGEAAGQQPQRKIHVRLETDKGAGVLGTGQETGGEKPKTGVAAGDLGPLKDRGKSPVKKRFNVPAGGPFEENDAVAKEKGWERRDYGGGFVYVIADDRPLPYKIDDTEYSDTMAPDPDTGEMERVWKPLDKYSLEEGDTVYIHPTDLFKSNKHLAGTWEIVEPPGDATEVKLRRQAPSGMEERTVRRSLLRRSPGAKAVVYSQGLVKGGYGKTLDIAKAKAQLRSMFKDNWTVIESNSRGIILRKKDGSGHLFKLIFGTTQEDTRYGAPQNENEVTGGSQLSINNKGTWNTIIKLAEMQGPRGQRFTVDHEIFHAISQLFLSDRDYRALIKRYGYTKTELAKKGWADLPAGEIRRLNFERIASKYAAWQRLKSRWDNAPLFQRILNSLKRFVRIVNPLLRAEKIMDTSPAKLLSRRTMQPSEAGRLIEERVGDETAVFDSKPRPATAPTERYTALEKKGKRAKELYTQPHGMTESAVYFVGRAGAKPERILGQFDHGRLFVDAVDNTFAKSRSEAARIILPLEDALRPIVEKKRSDSKKFSFEWGGRTIQTDEFEFLHRYFAEFYSKRLQEDGTYRDLPTENLRTFGKAWEQANRDIGNWGEKVGLINSKQRVAPEVYVPRRLTEEARRQVLSKTGPIYQALSLKFGDKTLIHMGRTGFNERQYSSLDFARTKDIPFYIADRSGKVHQVLETDPMALTFGHIQRASNRLATEEMFGKRFTEEAVDIAADPEIQAHVLEGEGDSISKVVNWLFHNTVEEARDKRQLFGDKASPTKEQIKEEFMAVWDMMQGRHVHGQFMAQHQSDQMRKFLEGAQSFDTIAKASMLSLASVQNTFAGWQAPAYWLGLGNAVNAYFRVAAAGLAPKGFSERTDTDKLFIRRLKMLGAFHGNVLDQLSMLEGMRGKSGWVAKQMLGKSFFTGANKWITLSSAYAAITTSLQEQVKAIQAFDREYFKELTDGEVSGDELWWASEAYRWMRNNYRLTHHEVLQIVASDGRNIPEHLQAKIVQRAADLTNAIGESPTQRTRLLITSPMANMMLAFTSFMRKQVDQLETATQEAKLGNYKPFAKIFVTGVVSQELARAVYGFFRDKDREEDGFLMRLFADLVGSGIFGIVSTMSGAFERSDSNTILGLGKNVWEDLMPPTISFGLGLGDAVGEELMLRLKQTFRDEEVTGVEPSPLLEFAERRVSGFDAVENFFDKIIGGTDRDARRLSYMTSDKMKRGMAVPKRGYENTARSIQERLRKDGRLREVLARAKEYRKARYDSKRKDEKED